MSLAFDENGRPFIILREQEKKKRVKGLEAHKVSLLVCFYKITQILHCCDRYKMELSGILFLKRVSNSRILDQHNGGTHCS